MSYQWLLSDNKSPQVFRTLLSILVYLNNGVVLMVSTSPLISMSSTPRINHLVTVSNAQITFSITVTFMFNGFSVLQEGLRTDPSFRFPSILHCGQQEKESRLFDRFSFFSFFFLLTITRSGRLASLRGFYTGVSRWFFTGVLVIVIFLGSPGFFSVLAYLNNAEVWIVSNRLWFLDP